MMHDFAITKNYVLFPVYPTTSDLDRLRSGGDHWIHEMDKDSWLGVMPRYGNVSELRWFKGPVGASCYHIMNAFEDADGEIHIDQCLSNTNAFPFIREASGIEIAPWDVKGALTRWSVNFNSADTDVKETIVGPPGDFPVIPASAQGRPYSQGWMLTMNPAMEGPPIAGGPVGAMFNMLVRLDHTNGSPNAHFIVDALPLPSGWSINEPVHVPAANSEQMGWLLAVVDHEMPEGGFEHALWVLNAGNLGSGPVATIPIPARLRPQVHGWWVSET